MLAVFIHPGIVKNPSFREGPTVDVSNSHSSCLLFKALCLPDSWVSSDLA